jgi:cell division protein FtsZ
VTDSEKQAATTGLAGRTLLVGVGNGAGRALAKIARNWPNGPAMAALNTDTRDFEKAPGLRCLQIGAKVMKGLGSGGDPRVGRRAAEADAAIIRELFHGIDLVILLVGLGGGIGTGAAPFVAEEARKAGAMVLGFAMLPFDFEGPRRMEHARHGLLALKAVADGVISVPNQRLIEGGFNMAEVFQKADTLLGRSLQALWRVLSRQGVINLDLADVRAVLREGGQCVLAWAEASGSGRIGLILQALRDDPILKRGQALAKAEAYLIGISGGEDLALKDVDLLMRGVAGLSRPEALARVGVICDSALKDRIFITLLVAEPGGELALPKEPHRPPGEPQKPAPADQPPATTGGGRDKLVQPGLFDGADSDRFKGTPPTIIGGENLDTPTFIRRRLMIQKIG